MFDHRPIIEGFGGIRPMARKLGHKHASRVQYWWETGTIPAPHWTEIERVAKANKIKVKLTDFLPKSQPAERAA